MSLTERMLFRLTLALTRVTAASAEAYVPWSWFLLPLAWTLRGSATLLCWLVTEDKSDD